MILCGHPTGNPFSYHAALAHQESGKLEAFCVPWIPSAREIAFLHGLSRAAGSTRLGQLVERLGRRRFPELDEAPKVEGRAGEWQRLLRRAAGWPVGRHEGNDWLMDTMARRTRSRPVTAVHSYEDCSLRQFEVAKGLGKACLYEMPIGYYPWWKDKREALLKEYADWLPAKESLSSRGVRERQKVEEMHLADTVLAPSEFVRDTILAYEPEKSVRVVPYGVDLDFWNAPAEVPKSGTGKRFIFVGQIGLRKGIPVLMRAWEMAGIKDWELVLVGAWQLSEAKRRLLPGNVRVAGPFPPEKVQAELRRSDVLVFPSFFEGLPLSVLEAMACGLPVIGSEVLRGMGLVDDSTGLLVQAGNAEQLAEALRWFARHAERVPAMGEAARTRVQQFSWERYRCVLAQTVSETL